MPSNTSISNLKEVKICAIHTLNRSDLVTIAFAFDYMFMYYTNFPFIWVGFFFSETSLCNIRICLTWSVNQTILTFRCRVHQLRFSVMIVNQYHNAQGYCLHPLPVPQCVSYHKNTTITQNASTNVTSLVVKGLIDNKVNGQWSCLHGTNREEAIVDVTVLKGMIIIVVYLI